MHQAQHGTDADGVTWAGIRGEAPRGQPLAVKQGRIDLPTRFVFGFRKHQGGEIPREWNVIGLHPGEGQGVRDVDNVGICWVHVVGAVVYFGPQVNWGPTWEEGDSWKSKQVVGAWRKRKPDGTHPFAPFVGGGWRYEGVGSGRLVFGCTIEDAAVDAGFLDVGHHPLQFCARIGVFGDRVLVANNVLPKSKRVFKYQLNGMTQIYDYGKPIGIDVNKNLLGICRDEGRCHGYFEPGVVVRGNWVYNHANKGYEVAGSWVTIRNNHNERDYLRSGSPKAYGIDGWTLTLDGRIVAKAPTDVQATIYEGDAVRITWKDTSDDELGFRVDRQIDGGKWHTIAYRPRQSHGHERNPAQWIDFVAPPGKELRYRVIACDPQDSDVAASRPTEPVRL